MPTALRDVRSQGQSGKHLLAASISPFDPTRTLSAKEEAMKGTCQVVATGTSPPAHTAEVGTKDFAARTELLPIQTLTLTDQQFLTGDSNGKPTAITGQLRIAQREARSQSAS
jgi:hypothetical protein